MSSEHSYATIANVENHTGIDYSTVDATAFADANIEATITIQEQKINAYLKVTSAETVTDGIKMCTIVLSAKSLYKQIKTLYPDNTTNIDYLDDLEYMVSFLGESSNKRDFALKTGVTDRFWS